jgi:hypothetical protein
MSIVTMKNKSNTIHSNISKNGFYLQGTLRQPPRNLIRTPTYTRMKGPDPVGVGSGSHCRVGGRYARICKHGYPIVIRQDIYNTLQTVPNVSTQSQYAMIDQRFRNYVSGPLQRNVAVPPPSNSVSDYMEETVQTVMNCSPLVGLGKTNTCPTKTTKTKTNTCQTTKTTNKYIVAYDTYLLKFKAKCKTEIVPKKVWHTNTLL